MAEESGQPIEDGTTDFSGGQDAYHIPDRIPQNAYAKAINTSVRRGVPHPRDGYERLELIFDEDTIPVTSYGRTRTIESIFRSGKFQSFIPYFVAPEYYFIIVIAGLIYRFNVRTLKISLLSKTVTVNEFSSRINWSLAGRYIVLFDFPNFPAIIEGEKVFRADPNNIVNNQLQPQVPVSTIGTFNQNRLAVANAGNDFTLGDPTGNLLTPEAPITFTEVLSPIATYPGQSFSLGTNNTNQPITAMGFLQSVDQNTGIGPLLVATQNSIYYYHTEAARAKWDTMDNFGSLLLFNAGVVGPRALVNVNSDILFLSGEGQVYALSSARNDAKQWGNSPISREVHNWLKYWDPALRQFAFLQYFNNRVFISANPYRVEAQTREGEPITDYTNGGMVALELDNTTTMAAEGPPVWAGLWTGLRPLDMAISNNQGYIMAKSGGQNHLFIIRSDTTYDFINGEVRDIQATIYTREFFAQSRFINKYETSISMPVQNLEGNLDLTIERRPSHSSIFKLWKHWLYEAPITQCEGTVYPNGLAPHRFRELNFGAPDSHEDCDPGNKLSYSVFRKLQLKITIKARNWQLEEIKIKSTASPNEDLNNTCEQEEVTEIPAQCDEDWFIEESPPCNHLQM